MKQTLYPWQEECLSRWMANRGRGMVQAVTGSGKTRLALEAAARLEEALGQELFVKIVVPTGSLLRQWNQALREFLEQKETETSQVERQQIKNLQTGNHQTRNLLMEIGLRGGGYKTPAITESAASEKNASSQTARTRSRKYMIYVVNSARYELARQILWELRNGEAVLLIADECHHYASGQNQLIFEFLPYLSSCPGQFFSLGLSATLPSGEDRRYLASVLGAKIYQYGMTEAAFQRTICHYDCYHIGLFFQEEEREQYEEMTGRLLYLDYQLKKLHPELKYLTGKERFETLRMLTANQNPRLAETAAQYMMLSYKRKSLVCQASSRIACACELIERLDPQERILIFGERIEQAEELYQRLQEQYPGRVGRYHSKMGPQANKNALERFRMGELRILIACKGMDEGVDIPEVSVGIILSGTSAQRQRTQRLGRIVRKQEGKERASLYYLHMTESSEDSCFLPEVGREKGKNAGNRIFELEYQASSGRFVHPAYDRAAKLVLNHSRRKGMSEEEIKEIQRCLSLGCVRADWLLTRAELEKNIREAAGMAERNYWICMKRVGIEGETL